MPTYAYAGVDLDGAEVTGTHKAATRGDAEVALYERDLRDLQITEKKSWLQYEISGPRIKAEEIMHLSRQIAAFLRAGLPILDAVHSIGEEHENSSIRRMMHDIEDGLRTGERFSDTLERHPKVFPMFYRGIVRSAELTGELDVVLHRLALYLERDLAARRKIKSAMTYPTVIAVLAVVVVTILAVFVLPKFQVFFDSFDATLPLVTRILLGITGFLSAWWYVLIGGIGAVVASVLAAIRTERGRHGFDAFLLKVPVLGETIRFAMVERFCRVMASMVNAGVNLPDALRVTTASLRNSVYRRGLSEVGEAMLEGQGLAEPLGRTQLFPGTAVQMLRVGEDTGSLDQQLEITAEYFESELDYKIQRLTGLFEPLVIVIMGVVVGFVAVALISAMYGVFNQVKIQ